MNAISVIDAGLRSTVQDLGRHGHAHRGVAPSGAADAIALCLGNRLLGNDDNAAAIETTLTGGAFRFDAECVIVVSGAPCEAHTPGRPIPMLRLVTIHTGDTLTLGPASQGVRTYLCVAGGVRTEPVLGSRSVHATSGFGASGGRTLREGDTVRFEVCEHDEPPVDRAALLVLSREAMSSRLRVVGDLPAMPVTVGRHSDRTGVRLEPDEPIEGTAATMDSEAMHPGAIQATPDGNLVALGPDGAPTGGYRVVASVIGADLPVLAQRRPGERVRLEPVTIDEARALLRRQRDLLDRAVPARETGRR